MKKLFVSQSLVEVESLKEVLENAGIACMVKNQQGSSLAGSVPFAEVFPELWVINDQDYERGKEFLTEQAKTITPKSSWTCAGCGERHAGEFASCWKCGQEKGSSEVRKYAVQPETPIPGGAIAFWGARRRFSWDRRHDDHLLAMEFFFSNRHGL